MSDIKLLDLHTPFLFLGEWFPCSDRETLFSLLNNKNRKEEIGSLVSQKSEGLFFEDERIYIIEGSRSFYGHALSLRSYEMAEAISQGSDSLEIVTVERGTLLFWQGASIERESEKRVKDEFEAFALWSSVGVVGKPFIREIIEDNKSEYQFLCRIKSEERLF